MVMYPEVLFLEFLDMKIMAVAFPENIAFLEHAYFRQGACIQVVGLPSQIDCQIVEIIFSEPARLVGVQNQKNSYPHSWKMKP
jgi:hypothetical protein